MDNAFHQKIDSFEAFVWYVEYHFKDFQNYRDQLNPSWEDSASRDINGRYLEPNKEDSEDFLEETKGQIQSLKAVAENVAKVSSCIPEVNKLSEEIGNLKLLVEDDLHRAAGDHEISRNNLEQSKIFLSQVDILLAQASNACG